MKYIKYIVATMLAVLTLTACETDVTTVELPESSQYKAPVLNQQGAIVINGDNIKTESVVFTCSKADFGVASAIQYSLYLKKGDLSVLAARSYYPSIIIGKSDFNGYVVNSLKVAANEAADVDAYVVASLGDSDIATPASNTVTFNVKTFKAALRATYIVGALQGWKPESGLLMLETAGGTNIYEGMFNFIDGGDGTSGFKITDAQDWTHGNWGFDAFKGVGAGITKSDDGNLVVAAGIYKISVNITAMTIEATPITTVSALGSFGGWEAGEVDMTYSAETNLWTSPVVTFADGLDFLIRLNKDWNSKLGDSGERDTELGGVNLIYKAGENILVPSAGSYILKLHANRTPYVLVMEKQ